METLPGTRAAPPARHVGTSLRVSPALGRGPARRHAGGGLFGGPRRVARAGVHRGGGLPARDALRRWDLLRRAAGGGRPDSGASGRGHAGVDPCGRRARSAGLTAGSSRTAGRRRPRRSESSRAVGAGSAGGGPAGAGPAGRAGRGAPSWSRGWPGRARLVGRRRRGLSAERSHRRHRRRLHRRGRLGPGRRGVRRTADPVRWAVLGRALRPAKLRRLRPAVSLRARVRFRRVLPRRPRALRGALRRPHVGPLELRGLRARLPPALPLRDGVLLGSVRAPGSPAGVREKQEGRRSPLATPPSARTRRASARLDLRLAPSTREITRTLGMVHAFNPSSGSVPAPPGFGPRRPGSREAFHGGSQSVEGSRARGAPRPSVSSSERVTPGTAEHPALDGAAPLPRGRNR